MRSGVRGASCVGRTAVPLSARRVSASASTRSMSELDLAGRLTGTMDVRPISDITRAPAAVTATEM